jgi:hypothetical protein
MKFFNEKPGMKVGIFMDENMVEQLLKDSWMKKTNR